MNKNKVLELIDQKVEIANKIKESELGKQLTKVSEQLNDLVKGFISFDQGHDPEHYGLAGIKEGDIINIIHSAEDGVMAIVLESDFEDGEVRFEYLEGKHKGRQDDTWVDECDLEPEDE